MLRAVIIEDEVDAVSLLKNIIASYCEDVTVIGDTDNADMGVTLIKNVQPDLVFLDIQLKNGTGFDLLTMLGKINFQTVFITAYDQYAIDAFKVNAVDYILKPYSPRDIQEAMVRVRGRIQNNNPDHGLIGLLESKNNENGSNTIVISNHQDLLIINIDDIIRIEADRSYCYVYLADDSIEYISKSLREMEELLSQKQFLRTHKSHLVNLEFIAKYITDNNGALVLSNKKIIPISRRRKKEVIGVIKNKLNPTGE